MIADEARRFYAVQFHPEVTHTEGGARLIEKFITDIAGCVADYSVANERERMVQGIRDQVGADGKCIVALSGGVDSSVLALLVHEALGARAICIHVDNGLMRKGESATVVKLFREAYKIPLDLVDARERFLGALKGVSDPEQKRKIIGKTFIDVFVEEAKGFGDAKFLAQGTLYPDVIESVSFDGSPTSTIKSHHNVGGLPAKLGLTLVEPLRRLFKDEVRALGRQLGLPEHFVDRHPFPGPGLGIRCPGAIEPWKLEMLRDADAIYQDELRRDGLYGKISQAFAIFDSTQTVGVQGDGRVYGPICVLRAFVTVDFMTGDAYEFEVSWLKKVMTRIINEVSGHDGVERKKFTRVLYDVTSKPPGTTEWE
jgi:GMP synthase (glutamine-hydrolysing)